MPANSRWDLIRGFKGLNPICHLLALLEAHHILHVSRIRVKYHFTLFAGSKPIQSSLSEASSKSRNKSQSCYQNSIHTDFSRNAVAPVLLKSRHNAALPILNSIFRPTKCLSKFSSRRRTQTVRFPSP